MFAISHIVTKSHIYVYLYFSDFYGLIIDENMLVCNHY